MTQLRSGGRSASIGALRGRNCADATAYGPPTVAWSCSTRPESARGATTTRGTKIASPWPSTMRRNARPAGACGAPGALEVHAGCGRRSGETHRWQHRQGAPDRPHAVPDGGGRPSISSPSQRWGEAGGSLSRGSPGKAGRPRQSRAGSALPDRLGPVSETGRYKRGTGCVTPLQQAPALTRWMWAGWRGVPAFHDGRGTPGRVCEAWAWRPR